AIIRPTKPIVTRSKAEAEAWYAEPGHKEYIGTTLASWIGVPMLAGEKVLGVIAAYDPNTDYVYDENDFQVLQTLASQAAIALDNARLYYEVNQNLERRVKALITLTEVGQKLTSGIRLTEDKILELIYQQTRELTGAGDMYIALYDDETAMIRFPLALEKGERKEKEEVYKPRQADLERRGKTEEIIHTRQPLLHRTKQEARDWYRQPGHQEFIGRVSACWLGVPMIVGERVLGVIALTDWEREYAYDELDQQILSSMASQAAIALDNARLYYEIYQNLERANQDLEYANRDLQRRVEALTALNKVGQTLTSGLGLTEEEILELIFEQTCVLTDTKDIYIAMYDDATQVLRFGPAMDKGQRVVLKPRPADMKQRGKTEEVIFTKQILLHKTKQESDDWYKLPEHAVFGGRPVHSWLGVPLIIRERMLGMIAIFDYEQEYAYDELDVQVLNSMAGQAAIALDNANLYQALERRVEALGALNDVGKRLAARLQEDEILELIYDEIRQLTGADNIYLALYDEKSDTIAFKLLLEKGRRLDPEQQPGFAPRKIDRTQLGKTEAVILQRQPILHQTRAEEEAWYQQPGHRQYIDRLAASHLAVPMLLGERASGVIAIYDWDTEYAYDAQDRDVLAIMAGQAAIALENARLFEAARHAAEERGRRLDSLQQINARMVEASQEPDAVLELVAQAANDFSRSDLTGIYLYDQEAAAFTRGVQVRRGGRAEPVAREQLPLAEDLPFQIAHTRQAEFVPDVSANPAAYTFALSHQLQAFAGLPLITAGAPAGQTTVGVLFVNFSQAHPFADDERELLHHLANQAAVAIAYASAQASAQAREQLAALGTAAASLQHRLGNTINVILPAVLRLRLRAGSDETNLQILDTIERNALFATEVIRRMQTPLRPESFVRTNISSLIRDAVQKCLQEKERFPQARLSTNLPEVIKEPAGAADESKAEIKIMVDLAEQMPTMSVRSGQITEVFRVLIENGIKAIHPQAGVVAVRCYPAGDRHRPCVEITVSDSGKGIDEKTRSRLFKQPVPRTVFGEGAGLGLWLSHFIVRSHQGTLRLHSTELGRGSTFVVRLPILDQPPAEAGSKEERHE
ncbi:MAG: GAF domain-containing protein, partial [Chloroflexota bacterium]